MNKYLQGKIYKITNYKTDMVYIGSTTQSLKTRLLKHESAYRCSSSRYCSSAEIIKDNMYDIKLIEKCPCETEQELRNVEGYWQRQYKNLGLLVNKNIEARSIKEIKEMGIKYRQKNKKQIDERSKIYYNENKEHVKEYRKKNRERIRKYMSVYNKRKSTCKCGCVVSTVHLARHQESKKHESIMKNPDNYVKCKCGCVLTKRALHNHKKSKTHQKLLNENLISVSKLLFNRLNFLKKLNSQ